MLPTTPASSASRSISRKSWRGGPPLLLTRISAVGTAGGLIHEVAEGTGARILNPMLARLKRAYQLHRDDDAEKVRALAREILNDWAAITAFVTNSDLPATNNEAERALRDAVIARRISNGTRSEEGSAAYAATLSVFETCRRRGVEPWQYITNLLARARKGLPHITIPLPA
jgi:transposase